MSLIDAVQPVMRIEFRIQSETYCYNGISGWWNQKTPEKKVLVA